MTQETESADLVHCIYVSTETSKFSKDQILSLLEKARKNNSELNVTGMLLYDRGSFFQALEGDRLVVEKLFQHISRDSRHENITKIILEPIEQRDFAAWTMGYSGVTTNELKTIDGLNDFFHQNKCFADLDEGRAKKLLAAFKDGKWRTTLS